MPKFMVVVMTNPREGMEAEYLDHYVNTHLSEVLATTPCTSAQHFTLAAQRGAEAQHEHMAVYEIEADSAEQVIEQMEANRDQREQSKAINRRDGAMWIFSPNGERLEV